MPPIPDATLSPSSKNETGRNTAHFHPSNFHSTPSKQGLTLVSISAQLEQTLPIAAQLKLTLSPK